MKYLIYILTIAFLFSCEETVQIDIDQAESKVVIEAMLTDQPDYQYVKISKTAGFYDDGYGASISTAIVSVSDDVGNTFNYSESMEVPGFYLPDVDFAGVVGRHYTLNVQIDGNVYSSTEELLPVTPIDSMTYEINEEEFKDKESDGFYYNVLLYTKEPQDEDNFYMFKFYRNGEVLNDNGEDITVTDDVAVGEAIEGLEMPEFHAIGDSVSMEMFSMTQRQYIYWFDISSLIFSDGGVFSPLPANPRSNISGGALGVFQVSSLQVDYVIIEE